MDKSFGDFFLQLLSRQIKKQRIWWLILTFIPGSNSLEFPRGSSISSSVPKDTINMTYFATSSNSCMGEGDIESVNDSRRNDSLVYIMKK